MNAFVFAGGIEPPPPTLNQEEEEEDRERNTSTRSPDSAAETGDFGSMEYALIPGLTSPFSSSTLPGSQFGASATNLKTMAASVVSSPLLNLFSKIMKNQPGNQPGENTMSSSPSNLAQFIDYYNRLRFMSTGPAAADFNSPINGSSSGGNPWSQGLLSAAVMAVANQPTLRERLASGTPLAAPSNLNSLMSMNTYQSPLTMSYSALRDFFQNQKHLTPNNLPDTLSIFSAVNAKKSDVSNNPVVRSTPVVADKQNLRIRLGRVGTDQRKQSTRNGPNGTRSSNVKKYRCDICDKTFSRSNTLITHKRIHTGEKPFRCEHCNRAFRQPGNLTRHRLTHTTVKPFVCTECDKAFNRASNLHTHMRTHSAPTWPPLVCSRCRKSFVHKSSLSAHVCSTITNN